jgi:hypothetical protein
MAKTHTIAFIVVLSALIINVTFAGSLFGGDDKPKKEEAPGKGKGKAKAKPKAYASGYKSGYESGAAKVYASGFQSGAAAAKPFSSTASPVLSETDVHEIVSEGDWNPSPEKVVLPMDNDRANEVVPEATESYAAYLRANKEAPAQEQEESYAAYLRANKQ